jgi:hypothetical protein
MYRPYSFKRHARPRAEQRIMDAYRDRHESCEACKVDPPSVSHHINTEKSGGPTEDWNFLALCAVCHDLIHRIGNRRFIERYPSTCDKIALAKLQMGRKIK